MSRDVQASIVRAGGLSRARRRTTFAAMTALIVVAVHGSAAAEDKSSLTVTESGGIYRVEATFSVPQTASAALATLTDYPQIPRFVPEVRSSTVLERGDERALVEQEAVARFMMFSRRVHLILEVQEERGTIRFRDTCGKSFARYEGLWMIAEREGHTHITYMLTAKPSFDVPEFLLKRLLKRDAGQMIERLKTEIAVRARASAY